MILSVLLAGGCDKKPQAGAPMAFPPAKVTSADVVTRDVPVYLDEIGKTAAYESVVIQPQISGKIVKIGFIDGADLKKGQELFAIDPRPFEAALEQANAALAQSNANLDFAREDFARMKEAVSTNAISHQEFDQKKSTLGVVEAQVQSAQAAVKTAALNLEYTSIRSPIDGRAGIHMVDVGNVVTANVASLVVIQRLEPIFVDFTIPENSLEDVRRAMGAQGALKVLASVPDSTDAPREGELTVLDNAVQESSGTVKLRGKLANADRGLWPGQFVKVRLVLRRNPEALLVPEQALQISQKGPFVYVVQQTSKDGKTQNVVDLRPVTPGQRQGDLVVIDKGLKPGEKVVITGQLTLFPGAPVEVVAPEAQTAASDGGQHAS